MFYYINQPSPSFPIRLVKTESDHTVISGDAYPSLVLPDLTCHLKDTGIGVFWLHCAT